MVSGLDLERTGEGIHHAAIYRMASFVVVSDFQVFLISHVFL